MSGMNESDRKNIYVMSRIILIHLSSFTFLAYIGKVLIQKMSTFLSLVLLSAALSLEEDFLIHLKKHKRKQDACGASFTTIL